MPLDISAIKDFHAHVYFELGVTEDAAARLRARVAGALSAIHGFGLAGL